MPEILSPVGNEAMLTAALNAGTDAIYLGTESFNARRNAENFTVGSLPEVVARCHIRGVKVYVTLNILIRDDEMNEARRLAYAVYNAGADGVIVADPGLAALLHGELPGLALHASTQMTVCSPGALEPLAQLGFTRVVAAREMSREALKELTEEAGKHGMEVEVFVHGALCMSVSGQCLLSAVLGGRSGNRGLCAGPCRLPFTGGHDNGYALSLKDLSLLPYLRELAAMGVASFKIEGRMKRPEYVAAATLAARQALTGAEDEKLPTLLRQVFSRSGFTDGYYTNRHDGSLFGARSKEDSLFSAAAQKQLHEYYRREPARIPLSMKFVMDGERPVRLQADDGEHTVTVTGPAPERAQTRSLDRAALERTLSKLGGTPYYLEGLQAVLTEGYTVPNGVLSTLKQQLIAALNEARSPRPVPAVWRPVARPVRVEKRPGSVLLRVAHVGQIPADLFGVQAVILPAETLTALPVLPDGVACWAELPRVCRESALRRYISRAASLGVTGVVCGNPAHLPLVKAAGLTAYAGPGSHLFSSFSLDWARQVGYAGALVSVELTAEQIPTGPLPTAVFAYGRLPLMVLGSCPRHQTAPCASCDGSYELTDRKGVKFPVVCRGETSELLNSVPVWLCDRADRIPADALLLYCTDESPDRVATVLKRAIQRAPLDVPYTRGLFLKGVL